MDKWKVHKKEATIPYI